MDLKVIKELIKSFEKSNVHKLEVEQDGLKVKLEKEDKQYTVVSEGLVPQALPQVSQNTVADKLLEEVDNGIKVVAPLVGSSKSEATTVLVPPVVLCSIALATPAATVTSCTDVPLILQLPIDVTNRAVAVPTGTDTHLF